MCGLASTRFWVAGSSSRACTASLCARQADTGSSFTDGQLGSWTLAPADRNGGSHSVRCRTTSGAVQPATGDGASQSRAPRTRWVNSPPTCRYRSGGLSASAIVDHPLQLSVTLADAGLHTAGQPGVSSLKAVHERLRAQPGAGAAEVLEPQGLQRYTVGLALVGEGLHDSVGAHLVEAATERVLCAAESGDVAPTAAGAGIPVLDPGAGGVRADPPGEQRGVGVGAEQLRGRGRELAGDPDDGQLRVGLDGRL